MVGRAQGKITSDEYNQMAGSLTQKEGTVVNDALAQIQAELEIRQWASQNGVTVTGQQVDAQIKDDATLAEMRHVLIIGVPAYPIPPATAITQVQAATKGPAR